MKNPIVLSLCALLCYAITNIIIDRKLSGISPVTNSLMFCGIMVIISFAAICMGFGVKADIAMISAGKLWPAIVVASIVFFAADMFYLGAYKAGGNVVTISTIISLFPIAVFLVELAIGEVKVSWTKFIGLLMAAGSVYLVSKK